MATHPEVRVLIDQVEHGTELDAFEAAKRLADAENVVADLGRILRSGPRTHSRQAAAYALACHESRNAVVPLLECAADAEEQEDVRGEAIEGLAKHLNEDPVGADLRTKAEDLMIDLLRSPSPVLRFWSCFGLGTLGCPRAVPHLREVSQKDPDECPGWWYIREEAEDALEWIAGRPGQDRIPIHMRNPRTTEPGAASNGSLAPPSGNSRVTKGPPSVS